MPSVLVQNPIHRSGRTPALPYPVYGEEPVYLYEIAKSSMTKQLQAIQPLQFQGIIKIW